MTAARSNFAFDIVLTICSVFCQYSTETSTGVLTNIAG